jgi:hypothetical protein
MNVDIGGLLDAWPFDPESNVRQVKTPEGREKIQVRVEQGPFRGILQMDLEGRPDGVRPHDREFALDFYVSQRDRYRREHGTDLGFELHREACKELFDESRRVYERYAFLLQLSDFERVVRDTERNMRLFRFVHKYASDLDDQENLERWWPYVIRINGMAKAMLAIRREEPEAAFQTIKRTRRTIRNLRPVPAAEFSLELDRSLEALDQLEKDLAQHRKPSLREQLAQELDAAIEREDYESAATLRDRLRTLRDDRGILASASRDRTHGSRTLDDR